FVVDGWMISVQCKSIFGRHRWAMRAYREDDETSQDWSGLHDSEDDALAAAMRIVRGETRTVADALTEERDRIARLIERGRSLGSWPADWEDARRVLVEWIRA